MEAALVVSLESVIEFFCMEYVDLYNDIFFESRPSPERHVHRLSTLAFLNGLETPPALRSRVLEVGCSTGANLIPMACALPEASFVGLDISSAQIKIASRHADSLNLKNIKFIEGDVRQEESLDGPFDYVICHGMLTWVDPGIQDHLLKFIARYLSPDGVCYLSFNSLPGWRNRHTVWNAVASVRAMKCPPQEKIERAKAIIRAMSAVLVDAHRPYGMQLKEELERNLERSNAFFAHEILNPFCSALTLPELKAKLKIYGLSYLCDANALRSPGLWSEFPELDDELKKEFPDPATAEIDTEHIADFLFPQSFRGAVVSLKKASPRLKQNPEIIENLFICSPLVPLDVQPDIFSTKAVTFCAPSEQTSEQSDPLVKSALLVLRSTWPTPIHFRELYKSALELVGLKADKDQLALLRLTLIHYFQGNHLELYREAYRTGNRSADYPEIFPFARLQSGKQEWVTTLRHETMPVDIFDRHLMPIINGENTLTSILEKMLSYTESGALQAQSQGEKVSSPDEVLEVLKDEIQQRLEKYIEQALLLERN